MLRRVAAVGLGLGLLACARSQPPLKLAVITTRTGPGSPEGEGLLRAVTLAVEEAAASGSVGRRVTLVTYDDRGEAEPAREAAREIAADPDVFAVVGPYYSVPALAAGRILSFKSVVMLTSAGSSELTRQQLAPDWREERVIFQMTASNSRQGDWDAEYAVRQLGLKRFAVVNDGGAYGSDIAAYFRDGALRRGGQIVWEGAAGPYAETRADAAARVAAAAPELVFVGGLPATAGAFMKAAREAGYQGLFMAGGGARTPQIFEHAGQAADGAYFSMQGILLDTMPGAAEFIERYRKRFGEDPRMMDHYSYDAARIALWAMKRTGGDRVAAAGAIRAAQHETMMGSLVFDDKGTALKGYVSMTRADAARRQFPAAN